MIVGNSAIEEDMVHVYLHMSFVGEKRKTITINCYDNNKVYSLA